MTEAAIPTTPARARPPGPGLGLSFIVMGVGLLIGIAAVVAIVIPLVNSFTSPVYDAPGQYSVHLKHNEYLVYQRTGTSSSFGSQQFSQVARLDPSDVSITDPNGSRVIVSFTSDDETITRGRAIYTSSLSFEAPMSGDYTLRFTNPQAEATTLIITRSISDAIEGVLVWFGLGALGGLIMVAGLVMLIVGVTRRGRAKRAAYAGWGQPQWGQQQQWGPPAQQQWGPPQQQWGPPAQQQWAPPQQQWGAPQQQWGPPPGAAPGYPPPPQPSPTYEPPPSEPRPSAEPPRPEPPAPEPPPQANP